MRIQTTKDLEQLFELCSVLKHQNNTRSFIKMMKHEIHLRKTYSTIRSIVNIPNTFNQLILIGSTYSCTLKDSVHFGGEILLEVLDTLLSHARFRTPCLINQINQKDTLGKTPLMNFFHALESRKKTDITLRHIQIFKMLIETGANILDLFSSEYNDTFQHVIKMCRVSKPFITSVLASTAIKIFSNDAQQSYQNLIYLKIVSARSDFKINYKKCSKPMKRINLHLLASYLQKNNNLFQPLYYFLRDEIEENHEKFKHLAKTFYKIAPGHFHELYKTFEPWSYVVSLILSCSKVKLSNYFLEQKISPSHPSYSAFTLIIQRLTKVIPDKKAEFEEELSSKIQNLEQILNSISEELESGRKVYLA